MPSYYYMKKSLAAGPALPQTLLGKLTMLPRPQVGPPTARACVARTLRFVPSALVPDCGVQIMVNLEMWVNVATPAVHCVTNMEQLTLASSV